MFAESSALQEPAFAVNSDPASIHIRRVGEYGHFVAPLAQLAADVEAFLEIDLQPYLAEVTTIRRDQQGVHPEEAGVLYLLMRGLRPQLVLETGTFKGYSTAQIARALRANGSGHLITTDIACDTGSEVPSDLLPHVTFNRGEASEAFAARMPGQQAINVFFHDSLHTFANTLGELIWFSDRYAPGAVIVCHDAKMDYLDDFGVGKAVRKFATQLKLPYRVLDTTCGLAILRWPNQPPADLIGELRDSYVQWLVRERQGSLRKLARKLLGS
jgi:predicted O-methyltransferase YrrM